MTPYLFQIRVHVLAGFTCSTVQVQVSFVCANMSRIQVSEGLQKEILKEGGGRRPKPGDTITVHCTGSLENPPKKFWRYL